MALLVVALAFAANARASSDGGTADDFDGDRIPDAVDQCPHEPETYNGYEDEDGCPDKADARVIRDYLYIADEVYFARGSATVRARSFPIMDALAATLRAYPQLQPVEVRGHATPDERDGLALRQAEAVVTGLCKRGIAAERLVAQSEATLTPRHGHEVRGAAHGPDLRVVDFHADFFKPPSSPAR